MSIRELRKYITEEIDKHGEITFLNAVAKFDHYQHVFPTLNQMRRAIEKIENVYVIKNDDQFIVKTNSSFKFDVDSITERDMKETYVAYLKEMNQR